MIAQPIYRICIYIDPIYCNTESVTCSDHKKGFVWRYRKFQSGKRSNHHADSKTKINYSLVVFFNLSSGFEDHQTKPMTQSLN